MQLKTGYKQTEIGVIPEDWEVKPLNEITSLMTNGCVGISKAHYTDFDNGVIYIQGFNVEENSFNFTGIKKVTEEFHKRHSKSCLQEGDLLTIQTGDVGLTTIVPKELAGSNCHALIITRFKKGKIEPKFFSYYFNSWKGKNQLKEIETGTTMKHINVGHMIDVQVPIPPKPEQTAIAAALYDVDALMGELDKLIAKKRDIKQATMQQLLTGKKRLAGFSGECEVKRLGEVAEIIGGGTASTFVSDYWNGNINWFTPTEIGTQKYVFDSVRKITKDGLINCSARILPIGTILLTSRAGIGDIGILKKEACTNQGFQSLVAKDGFYNEFLYYLVSTLKNVLIQNASGSTFLEISPNKIKQIQISIPNIEEQTAIATILSDMDAEINALQQKRDKTAQLKQGMMQELLTGRIRLNPQESTSC